MSSGEPRAGRSGTARRELVENELYEHATRLFAERGFAGTSLQDIADAMGITRPALYYYVKSKDELLAKLVTEVTDGPLDELTALVARDGLDPVQKLRGIVEVIVGRQAPPSPPGSACSSAPRPSCRPTSPPPTPTAAGPCSRSSPGSSRRACAAAGSGPSTPGWRRWACSACATGWPGGSTPAAATPPRRSPSSSPTWRSAPCSAPDRAGPRRRRPGRGPQDAAPGPRPPGAHPRRLTHYVELLTLPSTPRVRSERWTTACRASTTSRSRLSIPRRPCASTATSSASRSCTRSAPRAGARRTTRTSSTSSSTSATTTGSRSSTTSALEPDRRRSGRRATSTPASAPRCRSSSCAPATSPSTSTTRTDLLEYRRRLDDSAWPVEMQIQHETIESIYTHDPNGYMVEITRAMRPVTPQEDLDANLTIDALLDVVAEPEPTFGKLLARKAELIVERAAELGAGGAVTTLYVLDVPENTRAAEGRRGGPGRRRGQDRAVLRDQRARADRDRPAGHGLPARRLVLLRGGGGPRLADRPARQGRPARGARMTHRCWARAATSRPASGPRRPSRPCTSSPRPTGRRCAACWRRCRARARSCA